MQRVHFIAIGGASMHKLAIALSKKNNYVVSGSAVEISEKTSKRLGQHNLLPEKPGWYPERILKSLSAVIVGKEAGLDNPELVRARELGLKIYSVPEYLFHQTRSKTRIVVAGDENKKKVTLLILYVLKSLRIDADYMISSETNDLTESAKLGYESRIAVFEGEEVLFSHQDPRPRFLIYKPQIAVITGIEWNAENNYTSEEQYIEDYISFIDSMEFQGRLIFNESDTVLQQITQKLRRDIVSFGYLAHQCEIVENEFYLTTKKTKINLKLNNKTDLFNIEAARLACKQIGITDEQFYKSISGFDFKTLN